MLDRAAVKNVDILPGPSLSMCADYALKTQCTSVRDICLEASAEEGGLRKLVLKDTP